VAKTDYSNYVEILYCRECGWSIEGAIMNPKCPDCGERLYSKHKRTVIDIIPITESQASPYADTQDDVGETTMDEETENFFSTERNPVHIDDIL
jgi:predicted RNA-binding Zn-ribbon protein involved in translation (DUF1610 family)